MQPACVLDGLLVNPSYCGSQEEALAVLGGERNQASLGELLAGFFTYYAFEFDMTTTAVSPRTGSPIPKATLWAQRGEREKQQRKAKQQEVAISSLSSAAAPS